MIPELDTRIGTPRILVISAKAAARPAAILVIEATGTAAALSTYGPLASKPVSPRVNSDVSRWATGGNGLHRLINRFGWTHMTIPNSIRHHRRN